MRNDERYNPKPQSCQLEIFGLGAKGEADAEDARRWIDENPGAWNYMVENAVRLSKKGYVSANYLVNMVRNELKHVAGLGELQDVTEVEYRKVRLDRKSVV